MKPKIVIPLLLLLLGSSFTTLANKVNFTKSLAKAKQQAAQENKAYFIDFVASWCMPCQWMDETTFSDPQVSNYINQHYVAIRVDIDDFDGFALKQQYGIKLLPTILFFNPDGKQLARYEESLPPSKLMNIMQQFNPQPNRPSQPIATAPTPTPQAPQLPPVVEEQAVTDLTEPAIKLESVVKPSITRPPLPPTRQPPTPGAPSSYNQPTSTYRPPVYNQTTSKPPVTGEGLYEFSAKRIPSSGFSVQIGAYGEYGNVLREVTKLEETHDRPVLVHIAEYQGKTIYKVMLGAFPTQGEAIQYQQHLKQSGVIGIIKDLSTLQ